MSCSAHAACRVFRADLGYRPRVASPFVELEVDTPTGERLIKITNPEKTYFSGLPEGRGRKLDLVEYYLAVGDGIVRALRERPTVLKRHPGGAEDEAVYQKRVPDKRPEWLQTATVAFPSGRSATELCPVDVAHVVWASQMSTFDFHPWPSRRADVEQPDELRIDLDPMPGTGWADVQETASSSRRCSTSWATCRSPRPAAARASTSTCASPRAPVPRRAARRGRHRARAGAPPPDLATARWWKEERGERVFVDYNRMARDQTIASAYSCRARPTARCRRRSPGTRCPTARSPTSTSGPCATASP
jgi:DNA primase